MSNGIILLVADNSISFNSRRRFACWDFIG